MKTTKPIKRMADYEPGTPARDAIGRIANRWTILIVRTLEDGPIRFTDLKEKVGISAQVLTRSLRALERDGLIERRVHAEVPVRVEYSLTPLGGTMCPIVISIHQWAQDTAPAIASARASYDRHQRPTDPHTSE